MDNWLNKIIQGDCLDVMRDIPDKSVDMILCDLPYGTTACKWDTVIPFEPLWEQYKRLIKGNGAIVLTASQPFTTSLIASNMGMFKYCWYWNKVKSTGHLNANKQPLRIFEDVCIFSQGQTQYNPQVSPRNRRRIDRPRNKTYQGDGQQVYGTFEANGGIYDSYCPNQEIVVSSADQSNKQHPTQKPVALFEYLIATYTQPGEIVLDNCIGSGTTAVAALNTGRFFIGIEKELEYVEIAKRRVEQAQSQQSLFGG